MIQWLNTNFGTDTATYLGLAVGMVALFIGGNKVYKNQKKKRIIQHAVKTQGNVYQAGGDINQTTHIFNTTNDTEAESLKKKNDHDLKIIEEILTLLPYNETTNWVKQSYITGLPLQLSLNMDEAEKFNGEKYRLYNTGVNSAKNAFIEAMGRFNDSIIPFLHAEYPEREPIMMNPPHDWKYKGEKLESNFRQHQGNLRETSGVMVECYQDFVKTFKDQGFITDKL